MQFAFLGLACGCGGALTVLLLAASLLRLAVSATNKLIAPVKSQSTGRIAEWDWDDWDDEYAAPVRPRPPEGAIPEPGTVKSVGIVLTAALVFGLGFYGLGIAGQELVGLRMWRDEARLLIALIDLPVAYAALTALLIAMLPTTLWRAAMVAFVYHVFLFVFVLFVGALVLGAAALLG